MKQYHYLALLRGINVGGNNIIKMTALKDCFEKMGFEDVATYIQSGNVIFSSPEKDSGALELSIEKRLSKVFGYKASVVVISCAQLTKVVMGAPKGFGKDQALYRYDVLYLKHPLTASAAIKSVHPREGVDTAVAGKGVLYFSRLIEKASQSHLSKIIQSPIYKNITIRNWNTTTKLLALMNALAQDEER